MRSVVLCVALLFGCGDDSMGTGGSGGVGGSGGIGGSGGSGGSGGGHVADVMGTTIVTYVTDQGEMPLPVDVTAFAPKAIVLTSGQTINGTGDVNGNFSIPQVPDGALVQYGSNFVQLGAGRTLDFGYHQLGRPDVAHATMSGTQLNLQLQGMTPWATDDLLEMISSNAGAVRLLYGPGNTTAQNPPAPTATDLNMTVGLVNQPLVDSTKGDIEIQVQLVHHTSSTNLGFVSADKNTANAVNYDEMDGQITHVMGAYLTTTGTGSTTFDWRRSQFEALKTAVHPNATPKLQGIYVDAEPGGLTHGVFSNTIDVVASQPTLGTTDLNYGTVAYDNPFPPAWGLFGWVIHEYSVDYTATGATTAAPILAQLAWQADLPTFTAGPISPVAKPATSLKINGMDALTAMTGVGTDLTLSWTAPANSSASNYVIRLYKLTAAGTQTTQRVVARFFLAGDTLSLRMPPGVLTTGSNYVFEVQTIVMPGVDLVQKPFRVSLPMGTASALSAMVTP
jgi:hypothetical protein